jgi:hypothetical protein
MCLLTLFDLQEILSWKKNVTKLKKYEMDAQHFSHLKILKLLTENKFLWDKFYFLINSKWRMDQNNRFDNFFGII